MTGRRDVPVCSTAVRKERLSSLSALHTWKIDDAIEKMVERDGTKDYYG
jgi:hypothetical protein